MPNKIVQQLLGCLGVDCTIGNNLNTNRRIPTPQTYRPTYTSTPTRAPTPAPARVPTPAPAPAPAPAAARPAYTAPATRPMYTPGRQYSVAELNEFATSNLPSAANRSQFQSQLLKTLSLPGTSRSNKAGLCKNLSKLMGDQDQHEFHGAPRQANYFASYCVDLTLQELEQQYSAALENDLRSTLTLWLETLCPSQSEFNLNGVIYPRSELLNMLQKPNLISRQLQQASTGLAKQVEQRLLGVGTSSVNQTTHDRSVQRTGERVLNIMQAKHGKTTAISDQMVTTFVGNASKNHVSRTAILNGMRTCLNRTNRDNNWNVDISPQKAIKEVIQYIEATTDNTLRTNLTDSLLHRLREIHYEDPCVSGVLQRLFDVPNGIDPDMNFAGASRQIGEEMATVASKTYARFTDLIDEGLEAVARERPNPNVSRTIAGNIGRDMFHTRVEQDMKLLGGLSETELAPHRDRLKEGFN